MSGGNGKDASTGCILVVDDNDSIRRLAARVLNRNGFATESVAGSEAALALDPDWLREADLILTDVMLDDLTGPQLFERLRSINPNLRVLYTSGYGPDDIRARGIEVGHGEFLRKPWNVSQLVDTVRRTLG